MKTSLSVPMNNKVLLIDPSFVDKKNRYAKELYLRCEQWARSISMISYRFLLNLDAEKVAPMLEKNFTHIILTGVNAEDYSIDQRTEDVTKGFSWIKQIKIPCLGICCSHNIIGYLFGCQISHHEEMADGIREITLTDGYKQEHIFKSLHNKIQLACHHYDSISLPSDFILLGSSKECEVHIMRHKEKPIYGFQGHPEFTEDGNTILKNFILG